MTYTIRPAHHGDHSSLSPWTEHTFSWGDYVVASLDTWVEDPKARVLVASDSGDVAIAVANGVLLSSREMWIQGVRVHPEWRRRGIATELTHNLLAWGTEHGAIVARLTTDSWNDVAQTHFAALGFRPTCNWIRAFSTTVNARRGETPRPPQDPSTEGTRLTRAPRGEAGAAYLAWSSGELARAGRSLLCVNWTWRMLVPRDLERAAQHGALFYGPSGWAMAAVSNQELDVGWVQTSPSQIADHLDALIELATREGAAALDIKVPATDWAAAACELFGFETEQLTIYETTL